MMQLPAAGCLDQWNGEVHDVRECPDHALEATRHRKKGMGALRTDRLQKEAGPHAIGVIP